MSSWKEIVIQSVIGPVGDLLRAKSGVAASGSPADPATIASQLEVRADWSNAAYEAYVAKFGTDTNRILYSAMQARRLDGTQAKIQENFADAKSCGKAVKVFLKMCDQLVEPEPVQEAPEPVQEVVRRANIPEVQETDGTTLDDPVKSMITALGMPSMTDKHLMSVYILSKVMPNTAIGVRSYLEAKLNIREVHEPLVNAWLDSNTPMSMQTLEALGRDAGGFDDLPQSLHSWYKLNVPFRSSLAAAATQPNALALFQSYLRSPGTLGRRTMITSLAEVRDNFPSLDAWLASKLATK